MTSRRCNCWPGESWAVVMRWASRRRKGRAHPRRPVCGVPEEFRLNLSREFLGDMRTRVDGRGANFDTDAA